MKFWVTPLSGFRAGSSCSCRSQRALGVAFPRQVFREVDRRASFRSGVRVGKAIRAASKGAERSIDSAPLRRRERWDGRFRLSSADHEVRQPHHEPNLTRSRPSRKTFAPVFISLRRFACACRCRPSYSEIEKSCSLAERQPFRSDVRCLVWIPSCRGQFETGSRRATFITGGHSGLYSPPREETGTGSSQPRHQKRRQLSSRGLHKSRIPQVS